MADLLVRLYDLPPLAPAADALEPHGIEIRRARSFERPQVTLEDVDQARAAFTLMRRDPVAAMSLLQRLCG